MAAKPKARAHATSPMAKSACFQTGPREVGVAGRARVGAIGSWAMSRYGTALPASAHALCPPPLLGIRHGDSCLPRAFRAGTLDWAIDPAVVSYLNHGSFGVLPRAVLAAHCAVQDAMVGTEAVWFVEDWCRGLICGAAVVATVVRRRVHRAHHQRDPGRRDRLCESGLEAGR